MQTKRAIIWALLFTLLISACAAFEDPSKRATQNAQNTALWTRVHALETQESTMIALRQTADNAVIYQTQWAEATLQVGILRATNNALSRNPGVASSGSGNTGNSGGSVFSTTAPTVPSITPQPTPDTGTRYSQTTTSISKDEDTGCAVGVQNTFDANTDVIYFIVRALNVTPGTTFGLRVLSQNEQISNDPEFWTSDVIYDDTCIWYGIDRDTMPFVPGTYTAELVANGIVRVRTTFVINAGTGSDAGSEDDMSNEG
ncbi:MAG: hypothetical protein H6673_03390 [Anaerolineales bacterium]|nr:hypothetical protein [Anaerolineales bacterium]